MLQQTARRGTTFTWVSLVVALGLVFGDTAVAQNRCGAHAKGILNELATMNLAAWQCREQVAILDVPTVHRQTGYPRLATELRGQPKFSE